MKVFESKKKNILYLIYRLISPVCDPLKVFTGLTGYIWFARDAFRYKSFNKKAKILSLNLYPILNEKTPLTSFDAHYFYHPLWVFQHIYNKKPRHHVDVGSMYALSGYLSIITKVTFIDIRPIQTALKNLAIKNASVLDLPYRTNSIQSLSCLHVAEHIGLGRYGDPIDPEGTKKACREL
jgi:hypothetical protein